MSEKIIGIDLGTATTEAALFTDGQVHMIPNPDQQNITPSAVGLDETGKITVGEQAKASYLLAPERACTGSNPRAIDPANMEKLLTCTYYGTEVDF